MNKPVIVIGLALAAAGVLLGITAGAAEPQTSRRQAVPDERSYSIGYDLGRQTAARLVADGVRFDHDALLSGFTAAVAGRDPAITDDRMQDVLAQLDREVRERDVQRRLREDPVFKTLHDENLRRSREHHASFGREEGVETLPSGIQRRVLTTGSGRPVKAESVIVVDYRASLLDGYVFGEKHHAELRVAGLLPGIQRLVTQMRGGDHWYVAIPPTSAFGAAGRDGDIGPNETVLLEVEIVEVRSDRQ
ncbi:MAG: hypothetical protein GY715_05710 [Planctomycetes bacterium]|nr:hypothetical protein [Planctomycetota bacterium]